MRKLYTNLNSYLFCCNTADGESGASSTDTTTTPDSGQEAPTTDVVDTSGAAVDGGVNGEGTDTSDWRSVVKDANLDPEVMDHEILKDITSVDDLVKALVAKETSKGDTGTTEESEEGVLEIPENAGSFIKAYAESKGLDQDALNLVLDFQKEAQGSHLNTYLVDQKKGLSDLYEKWGDDAQANLVLANKVINFVDPDGKSGLKTFLTSEESMYAAQNPVVIEMFHKLSEVFKGSGFVKSGRPAKAEPVGNKAHLSYPNDAPNTN